MSNKTTLKPLAIAIGTAFVTTLATTQIANAADNPFAMTELSNGYMVADSTEGKLEKTKEDGMDKSKETESGADKMEKVKEVNCGEGHTAKKLKEGRCGEGKTHKMKEGQCGEAKCGANKMKAAVMGKAKEGKCGGSK